MYDQESKREKHLIILFCYTLFVVVLAMEAIFYKWDVGAVILVISGLIAAWYIHISEKISESASRWLYFILMMLTVYFYGIHKSSVYNLAAVMVVIILIFSATEEYHFVRISAVMYYLIMIYDLVFVMDVHILKPAQAEARLPLHFAIVFMAERLVEAVIQWRRRERSKTEERISRLEESNQRAEDFLANMSHELRTPINAVIGITTVMLKSEEDEEKKKDIHSIQMAGNRLFDQIEDILDYTEIDSNSVVVTEENYAISSVIHDIIMGNRLIHQKEGVDLIFDVDAKIPSTLLGDGRKIKKIIQHLVSNATKFTKKGGVYVRVFALPKSYGINLCIQVSDTGIGISEGDMSKIKEKFFQSSSGRNRKSSGLGLGISIVYGMVTAMNGFMQIESKEDSGTTVSISIPQKIADDSTSIVIENREDLCLACYLIPEKYEVPEVRDYYNATLSHMVRELDVTLRRVFTLDELKKLASMYQLTHLLIGREEYEESPSYFDSLTQETEVIVVADDSFQPEKNSRVKLVRKPFYSLPIVNILNSQAGAESGILEQVDIICPGVRVLVVDDEPMNLLVAEGVFNAYQMELKTAGSGMEAIEICKEEEFDLVFLDHMMPEMDGVETLKILQKNQQDEENRPTFIAFTANAVSGAKEMFLQEGFDEFISKPIEDLELKRLLRKVLPKSAIIYVQEDIKPISKKEEKEDVKPAGTAQTDTEESVPEKGSEQPVPEEESENESEKDNLTLLEEKGFRTKAGMIYCRNDVEYYEKLLAMFADTSEKKITDIETSYQEEDTKNYQIMVHALKSSAKMIGADDLSEMAKGSEMAAKNQDLDYIQEHHAALLEKYRETVRSILDVLRPDEPDIQEEEEATGRLVTKEELISTLSELKECLDIFEENEAEKLLAELNGTVYQGKAVSGLLREIKQDVENFDLATASEKVEALIDSMEGGEAS